MNCTESFQEDYPRINLTIEALEQGVKYGIVLVSLLLTLNIFHTMF